MRENLTFDSDVICNYIMHDLNNFLTKHGLDNNKDNILLIIFESKSRHISDSRG
jgi:hypothetical protein